MKQQHDTKQQSDCPALPPRLKTVLQAPLDVKLHLLNHYHELARMLVYEILGEEVQHLAGARYSRDRPFDGRYVRWGNNPGSVPLNGERVPIDVPRLRDRFLGQERPLESYKAIKEGTDVVDRLTREDRLSQMLLRGLSTRDYGQVARAFVDGFGLSQSSVSRAFVERSQRALEAFEARRLDEEDFVALWIDGKHLAKQQMVICLGLTLDGRKLPLGFVQSTTENAEAINFAQPVATRLYFQTGPLGGHRRGQGVDFGCGAGLRLLCAHPALSVAQAREWR